MMTNPFRTRLESTSTDFEVLADAVDQYPLTDDTLDEVAAQIDDLSQRIEALEAQRDLLKKNLTNRLVADGLKKYMARRYEVTRVAAARKVVLNDGVKPELLPAEYQTVTVNAKAVRDADKDGVDLSAFCALAEPTYYLRITARK